MKILLIRFSSLGDIVLTTPVPRLLRKKFPKSEIHFITKAEYSDIYTNNNNVNKIIHLQKNLKKTINILRSEKYDLVIDLHNNIRSNFIKFSLAVKNYTYDKQSFRRWLLTNFKIYSKLKHISESYVDTLKTLGIRDDNNGLDFYLHEKDMIDLNKLPYEFRSGFYVLVLGGKHKTKRLPVKKCIELCDKINKPIVLIGGKNEQSDSLEIENFFKSEIDTDDSISEVLNKKTLIHNLCGKLSIMESAWFLKLANVVYSNDTGFMHIAAALKKKVVSIFGSTHPSLGFYPYRTNFFVYQNTRLSCRPCTKIGHSDCPAGHFKCMNELKFDDIIL
tara:strand:- start:633 stop:1631 length:999 start_codon:yes stop_codon:yes gene_type:complete